MIRNLNKLLVLLFFTGLLHTAYGQQAFTCGTKHEASFAEKAADCGNTSTDWLNKYRKPGTWTPNSNTPVKTILINFIMCRKDDGSNGWVDSPLFRHELSVLMDSLNRAYSNSKVRGYSVPCMPAYTHITDTKIRFELNEVIFIDSTAFNASTSANAIINYVHAKYPNTRKGMNHIFTMPSPGPTYMGYYSYTSQDAYVITFGAMWSDYTLAYPDLMGHVAHEYGHAVGLHHIYDAEEKVISDFDFLDDVFGTCAVPPGPCTLPAYCTPPAGQVCNLNACFFGAGPSPFMSSGANAGYISPKAMGRMHRALSLFDNGLASGFQVDNRQMHKYVKEKTPFAQPLTIKANETWDFAIKMYQNIVVNTGRTLTIKCEVRMPIGGKIIVEPGAKLIIDGGKITSAHDQLWAGIEVQGISTANQSSLSGVYQQGYVELKNDAIIENATIGVKCDNGGIIIARNSKFRNNAEAVRFNPFINRNASMAIIANVSNFEYCQFITDAALLGNQPFSAFIYSTGVWLSRFTGNIFENTRTGVTSSADLGTGIYSYASRLNIRSACVPLVVDPCPEGNIVWNEFRNLNIGVRISDVDPSSVSSSKFIDCSYGILSESSYDVTIFGNRIWVGACSATDSKPEYGIMLNGDTYGMNVSTNRIYQSTGSNAFQTIGIAARATGSNNNTITNNYINGLDIGNLALNNNRSISTSTGLLYTCNSHVGTGEDIYVSYEPGLYSSSGIRYYQGATTSSAGNTFTRDGVGTETDFHNLTYNPLYYYWDNNLNKKPLYYTPTRVVLHTTAATARTCTPGGFGEIIMEKSGVASTFDQYDQQYASLQEMTNRLRNSGKTSNQEVLSQLETAGIEVSDDIRNQLADEKNDGLQVLDQLMADATLYKDLSIREMIANLNSTDEAPDAELVNSWQAKRNSPYTELNSITGALMSGNIAPGTDEQLESITTRYALDELQQADIASFRAFYREVKIWIQQGKTLDSLSEGEIAFLRKEADKTGEHRSMIVSRNLLNVYYGGQYVPKPEWITTPEAGNEVIVDGATTTDNQFTVFPNPASEKVTIAWKPKEGEKFHLEVTNLSGAVLHTQTGISGRMELDVHKYAEGAYVCKLTAVKGDETKVFKLVVKH